MPANVHKIGETHRQSPSQRAKQFTGVDGLVQWDVVRAIATPDSRYTEKLVHRRLKAMGRQYQPRGELFAVSAEEAASILQECAALTPVPAKATPSLSREIAVPSERGPWSLALAMPVTFSEEPGITLARAMALAAKGNRTLRRRLTNWGVELVYPDELKPHFRIHALPGSTLTKWLTTQALSWESLNLVTGSSRAVRCSVKARP